MEGIPEDAVDFTFSRCLRHILLDTRTNINETDMKRCSKQRLNHFPTVCFAAVFHVFLGNVRFLSVFLSFLFIFQYGTFFAKEIVVSAHVLKDLKGKPLPHDSRFGGGNIFIADQYLPKNNEMRGIWIATVYNNDFPVSSTAEKFRQNYLSVLSRSERAGINTIYFQVRPKNDAFYASKLNPWSQFLTGKEGQFYSDNFDPLRFMVQETHRRGMKFYATLNPYRIAVMRTKDGTVSQYLNSLSSLNYARQHPEHVLKVKTSKGSYLLLNPGEPKVRAFIADTVSEIISNYAVDGIVFDDFFYPMEIRAEKSDYDTWRRLHSGNMGIEDWRRQNTELMVRGVSTVIASYNRRNKKNIQFGISPCSVWMNRSKAFPEGSLSTGLQSYADSYFDIRKMVLNNQIDFVAPQVYSGFSHSAAPYATMVDWWCETVRDTNVKLYIAHGIYRIGEENDMSSVQELTNQMLYNVLKPKVSGSILFPYNSVFKPKTDKIKLSCQALIEMLWKKQYLPETSAKSK